MVRPRSAGAAAGRSSTATWKANQRLAAQLRKAENDPVLVTLGANDRCWCGKKRNHLKPGAVHPSDRPVPPKLTRKKSEPKRK